MVLCSEACEKILQVLDNAVQRGYLTGVDLQELNEILHDLESSAMITFRVETLRKFCEQGCPDVDALLPRCVEELKDKLSNLNILTPRHVLEQVRHDVARLCEEINRRVTVVSRSACLELIQTYEQIIEELRQRNQALVDSVYSRYAEKIRDLKDRLRLS